AAVPQLDRARDGAELARVDRVARERGPATDDLVAGLEHRLAEAVHEPVGACTGSYLLEAQVKPLGERRPEPVGAAVRVAVQLGRAPLDRLARFRERPERAFVRGELDDSVEPELALHLLDRLARLVRNEVVDRRREEAVRDLGKPPGHESNLTSRAASPRGSGSGPRPGRRRMPPRASSPSAP